jgi:hypothetical protein
LKQENGGKSYTEVYNFTIAMRQASYYDNSDATDQHPTRDVVLATCCNRIWMGLRKARSCRSNLYYALSRWILLDVRLYAIRKTLIDA